MKKKALGSFSIVLLFVLCTPVLVLNVDGSKAEFYLKPRIVQENRVEAFNTLLLELAGISDNTTKMSKINEFMTEQQPYGFPVTHDDAIIFIYRTNNASVVEIEGTPDRVRVELHHIEGTDLFYRQFTFPNDARGSYGFREDGGPGLKDPLNPIKIALGSLDVIPDTFSVGQQLLVISDFQMPEYADDGAYLFSETIGSVMVNDTFFSANTESNYTLQIYLPAGYNKSQTQRYASVYVGDGVYYAYAWNGQQILDYLDFHNKTEPLIGVFITPIEYSANRNRDFLFGRKNYADFIVEELMPYIDSKYRTINDSKSRAHIGSSGGGVFSLYIVAEYPQFFKLAGAQSVSVYEYSTGMISGTTYPTLEEYFRHSPKIEDTRFYLNGGTYEEGILKEAHKIANTLAAKEYVGKFRAFHQAHDPGQWRATLSEMLTFLFTDAEPDYSGSPIYYGNIGKATPFPSVSIFGVMLLILAFRRKNSVFRTLILKVSGKE
ncbi:MAG: alpha/beta hydrolase-fold protein [Candidatus Heimdallarchaeota archaeon]